MPEHLNVAFSANAHASLGSDVEREAFLASFRPSGQVVGPGALGLVRLESWPEEIRIAIEPSIGLPNSLFFSWNTRFLPSDEPLSALQTLVSAFVSAAQVYGVNFKPLS